MTPQRIVTAMPTPSRWSNGVLPAPLDRADTTYWYSARPAIWQGLRCLGLGEGDRILAPAYACGSEVDVLVHAGLSIDYYRIRPDLSADLDHIESLCRQKPRALFVTNYFGFPQPLDAIARFAREKRLTLIEDNAHGLYSRDERGRPLGSFGDISVFSFAKTLSIPDGGALVVNGECRHSPRELPSRGPAIRPVAGKLKFLTERALRRRFPRAAGGIKRSLLDPATRWLKSGPGGGGNGAAVEEGDSDELRTIGFDRGRADWRMSAAARIVLRATPHRAVLEARRRHYTALLRGLPEHPAATPLLPDLPEGCCPLFLPLRVADAPAFQGHLAGCGIESKWFWSFSHPAMPMDRFPFEASLKRTVVALPIHQSLGEDDLGRIGDATRSWCESRERRSSRLP